MAAMKRPLAPATALLAACHPEAAGAVAVASALLAVAAGRGWGSLWVLAAIGAGQLFVGWSNDWLDRAVDRAQGRRDKPLATGAIGSRAVGVAALAALVAAVPLSLASGVASAGTHGVALVCAAAYNAGLKRLPVSPLPFAAAFGLVPAVVTLGLTPPRLPAWWAYAGGALLGVAGHFTQVLRDIPADRAAGSRGLPQLLGQRRSAMVACAALLGAAAVVVFARVPPSPLAVAALGLAGAGVVAVQAALATGRLPLAFRATLAVAVLTVAAVLAGGQRL
jgi:4-hydroxybenzoate polyprenyltransferase